jgi:hypothetical protein
MTNFTLNIPVPRSTLSLCRELKSYQFTHIRYTAPL